MLWGKEIQYHEAPFELESEIEDAIVEISSVLFGKNRIYLDVKKENWSKRKN